MGAGGLGCLTWDLTPDEQCSSNLTSGTLACAITTMESAEVTACGATDDCLRNRFAHAYSILRICRVRAMLRSHTSTSGGKEVVWGCNWLVMTEAYAQCAGLDMDSPSLAHHSPTPTLVHNERLHVTTESRLTLWSVVSRKSVSATTS